MIEVLAGQDFDSAVTFTAALNKARLENKKSWIVYAGRVAGKDVQIKTYDTGYLQIFRIDGREQCAVMDMKPTAWKEFIQERLERTPA